MARRKKPRCPPPAANAVDERESGLDLGIMGEPSSEPTRPTIAPMPEPRVVVMVGHRDVSRKSCPGPAVYQQVVEPLARPLTE